jgi:hypothetical protein
MNLSTETQCLLYKEFIENCPDFLERASKLKAVTDEELEDPSENFYASLPRFLFIDCDPHGKIESSLLLVTNTELGLPSKIPLSIRKKFEDVCRFVYERAIEFRDPLMFVGTTFENDNGQVTHYLSYLYEADEALELLSEYRKNFFEFVMEDTGCNSFEDAIAFLEARQVARKTQSIKKARKKEEANFEDEVFSFLENRGFNPLRQVKSGNLRMDLLIPGQLVIELKAGKVTADDVCQAIDYLASHSMDVLLVGTGLTSAATRGIEAVNRISDINQLMFVTRNACFRYLNGVLGREQ